MPGSPERSGGLGLTSMDKMFSGVDRGVAEKAYALYCNYAEAGVSVHDLNTWMYWIQHHTYFLRQGGSPEQIAEHEAKLKKLQDGPKGGRRVSDADWKNLLAACGYTAAK